MTTRSCVRPVRLALTLMGLFSTTLPALAHNPIAECSVVEGATIECRGGFSDGSGAAGVTLDVISYDEQVLVPGKLDDDSKLRFKRPEGEFYILFDAGPGHVVEIDYHDVDGLKP
ncbi:hypothetical protein QEZ48_07495 [Aquamicrobium lusatiense]|uniref:hypothetical protein n=1 Tax=Aquamicrobium lusatiense TaxID=89772 RepID=UPI002456A4D3|nr:hypothetical protein [Aquamicrobium lusatiense]MDH4990673.1 hypothetical protein [Aquamicrobium lusatiense]